MYKEKSKIYFIIAIVYWIIYMVGLFIMGMLYKKGFNNYNIIYWGISIAGILIVLIKDKSLTNLGFTKTKLKNNLTISIIIIIITFLISIIVGKHSLFNLIRKTIYYLFYISLLEEILYRGFIQNYLFGLKYNKNVIYAIGALLFSLMHLPFQMYVHNNISFNYIIEALPQLIICFMFHFIMCFITYKREDITIPVALHYAIDYTQTML